MVRNLLFYEQASREFFSSMYPLHAEGHGRRFSPLPSLLRICHGCVSICLCTQKTLLMHHDGGKSQKKLSIKDIVMFGRKYEEICKNSADGLSASWHSCAGQCCRLQNKRQMDQPFRLRTEREHDGGATDRQAMPRALTTSKPCSAGASSWMPLLPITFPARCTSRSASTAGARPPQAVSWDLTPTWSASSMPISTGVFRRPI